MEYVNLGATGLRVSRICLGMMSFGNDSERPWVLDEDAAEPIVRTAAEGGVTFFDTADIYSAGASEVATGRLLGKFFDRDEVVVATKVYMPMTAGENGRGLSRKHILSAIDASLARLGMDYVDLYQIHRWDPQTPIEETMEALHDVVRAGQGPLHRRQQHVRLAVRQGPARRRAARLDPVRVHAEPLQPGLPRRGAGDDPAVHRPGRRRDPVEPAGPRAARRQPDPCGEKRTTRSNTDTFGDYLYNQPTDFDVVDRVAEVAGGARRAGRAGRAGLAAAPPGGDRADRRRHQGSGTWRTRIAAEKLELSDGRDQPAGGAVRAASRSRPRLTW